MNIIIYSATILLALAGILKMVGIKPMVEQFAEFGLPKIAMRLIGLAEVAAAVGLWLPGLRQYAAGGMVLMMLGAIANHIKVKHPISQSFPAILVLVLCALIVAFG
ncbi:DoxX family protein [Persicirhabdus sediminis]|uniref:DoxX family protein n=1 Tax=Persicirhabdus sediminis TaxID=454144 RepID=A0A8J7SHL1_9BACT|nr:DoxX family protein [Persicirhabdus sediminis]MBK1790860.1 DoxX family protein [Persicirhabdus sediminis]